MAPLAAVERMYASPAGSYEALIAEHEMFRARMRRLFEGKIGTRREVPRNRWKNPRAPLPPRSL